VTSNLWCSIELQNAFIGSLRWMSSSGGDIQREGHGLAASFSPICGPEQAKEIATKNTKAEKKTSSRMIFAFFVIFVAIFW
jgi:hypothetical protein